MLAGSAPEGSRQLWGIRMRFVRSWTRRRNARETTQPYRLPSADESARPSIQQINAATQWLNGRYREYRDGSSTIEFMPSSYLNRFNVRDQIPMESEESMSWLLNLAGKPWAVLREDSHDRRHVIALNFAIIAFALVLAYVFLVAGGDCPELLATARCRSVPLGPDLDSLSLSIGIAAIWVTLTVVEVGADNISGTDVAEGREADVPFDPPNPTGKSHEAMISDFWVVHMAISVLSFALGILMMARLITRTRLESSSSGADYVSLFVLIGIGCAAFVYQHRFSRLPSMQLKRRDWSEKRIIEASIFLQRHHATQTSTVRIVILQLLSILPILVVLCLVVWAETRDPRGPSSPVEPSRSAAVAVLAFCALLCFMWLVHRRWKYAWRAGARDEFGMDWLRIPLELLSSSATIGFVGFLFLLGMFLVSDVFGPNTGADEALISVAASVICVLIFLGIVEMSTAYADRHGVRSLRRARRKARQTLRMSKEEYRTLYPEGRSAYSFNSCERGGHH